MEACPFIETVFSCFLSLLSNVADKTRSSHVEARPSPRHAQTFSLHSAETNNAHWRQLRIIRKFLMYAVW